jgi:aerobic carbon-monoxide dehydrogenase small subunit
VSARAVEFELNGEPTTALAAPLESLQSVLRDRLGMTGTKAGCRQGGCGSCTVQLDGEPVLSCLVPVEHAEGRAVTTIEAYASVEELSPLQAAFHEGFASQCGFCSPGMISLAAALLERDPDPSPERIAEALAGNVCRCTGIAPIIDAIEDAATRMREAA